MTNAQAALLAACTVLAPSFAALLKESPEGSVEDLRELALEFEALLDGRHRDRQLNQPSFKKDGP